MNSQKLSRPMPENQHDFDALAAELMAELELPAASAHRLILQQWPESARFSAWRFPRPANSTAPPIMHQAAPEISTR